MPFVQKDPEEGSPCRDFFCQGHYVIAYRGDCTCHICPPCPRCTESTLRCDACEEEVNG